MGKQRRAIGDFLKINLSNGKIGYARVLKMASVAIYDFMTNDVADVSEIAQREVLFIVAVYDDVITSGRWQKIGKLPLEDKFEQLPVKFIQDALDPNSFELYDPNSGKIEKTQKNKCIGLERASVWEGEHVEERIVDYYLGRPNIWVEEMKIK
ncbi:hypothetical protein DBR43_33045 [Pedobacter sp. KBW06]|nr:hypothetical protein DBR43_33045 [Pedobacter sp. KBW06]